MKARKHTIGVTVSLFILALSLSGYTDNPGGGDHGPGPGDFEGHRGHEIEHNMVLPQIAVGKDISTTLVISSQANTEMITWLEEEDLGVTGTVYFFHQDGSPMEVQINGGRQASGEHAFQLAPSTMSFLEITSGGPNMPGWALITVDESEHDWGMRDGHSTARGERLSATGFYTIRGEGNTITSKVGVLPSMYEREHFFNSVLVARFGEDVNMGVAIVNTSSATVNIQARLKDTDALAVAENNAIVLEAGNQQALFIDELFAEPIVDGFQGSLEIITQEEGVVVMGLLQTQGILTSIPTHHFGGWQQPGGMMP